MEHKKVLELLYPREHPYEFLNLEILPVLTIIGLRFQYSDIKDMSALLSFKTNGELNKTAYFRYKHGLLRNKLYCTDTLLRLLGYSPRTKGRSKEQFLRRFEAFVVHERRGIKNNLAAPFFKTNVMSIGRLSFTLCLGAFFIKHAYGDIERYRENFTSEIARFEKRYDPIQFMRYLLNGARAEFWPYDTSFTAERDLLYRYAGGYMDFIGRKSGMKDDRLGNLSAMIVAGMTTETRREKTIKKQEKKPVRIDSQLGLGLYRQ